MENSHATKVQWTRVIIDTIDGVPIDKTAEELHLHHETVFNMRHKVMLGLVTFLDKDPVLLKEIAELDETYVLESQKGMRVTHRKPRKHGEGASKRGLSDEQLCVCVAADRDNHVIARCVNRAKPSSEDLANALAEHIAGKSLLLCDGATSYNYLAEKTDCEKISLVGHESYNKVYHLNTVNSLHSRFKEMLRTFRGVATKYLNRYAALFALIVMSAEHSVAEATDQIRRLLQSLRLSITIKSAKALNILAI